MNCMDSHESQSPESESKVASVEMFANENSNSSNSSNRVFECELTNFFKILLNETDGQSLPTKFVIHVTRDYDESPEQTQLAGPDSEAKVEDEVNPAMLGEVIITEHGFVPPSFLPLESSYQKNGDTPPKDRIHPIPEGEDDKQSGVFYSSAEEQERMLKKKRPQTQHLFAPSNNRPHCCAECGETFKRREDYLKHLEEYAADRYHACIDREPPALPNPPAPPMIHRPTMDKPFICGNCGKSFRIRSNLVQHIQIHTTDKVHVCETCGKAFKTKSNLAQHGLIHTSERTHFCMKCGKVFKTKSNLRQHSLIHTDEKPFSCVQCGKMFKTKSNLAQHFLIHNAERTHACMHCPKVFKTKSNLAQHLLVHTSERSHVCNRCGKAFKTKSNLAQHYRCHANDVPTNVVYQETVTTS